MAENAAKSKYKYMQNRELSWLRFNERVLQEAVGKDTPLYEKLKFISIFVSNLDEFFMVRVGSLFDLSIADKKAIDNKTGMTPSEQLTKIYEAVAPLYKKKDEIYDTVSRKLKKHDITHLKPDDLTADEVKFVRDYYNNYVEPILSPQLLDEHHPFPFIASKQLCVIGKIQRKKNQCVGFAAVPPTLPPVLFMPGKKIRYIHIEDIIYMYFDSLFGKYTITKKNIICATRNADINPNDEAYEINEDFRSKMKKVLKKRRRLAVVRLETASPLEDDYTKKLLRDKLSIGDSQIFVTRSPISLGYVFDIESRLTSEQRLGLCYRPFEPQVTRGDIMTNENDGDVLLSYPYESMEPFLNMLKRAARDPEVVSIKITIYRLAKNAKIIEHLCAAAENGKEVLVLIELRARFDEQNNIDWSERLEQAGCTIIYGLENYKVHSKVCLITKNVDGETRYITQIGTGNYNEKTAKQYTDFSLITQNREIGEDAADFFSNISISNLDGEYKHLWVAPNAMKDKIIGYIDEEIKKGRDGEIFMKVNSVTDKDVIKKLRDASVAGVNITMLVRGICCLLPQIPGVTENIRVYSIVGRFLEHSRIYSFGRGDEEKLFIASADIMTRNMDNRVEVGCPIYSDEVREKIHHYIKICLSDTLQARVLGSDGTYSVKADTLSSVNAQEVLMNEAKQEAKALLAAPKPQPKPEPEPAPEPAKKTGFFRSRYNAFIERLYNNIQNQK